MKAILLQTPAADNGGARRDAGQTVTVGEKKSEIDLERAKALVAAGSAVSETLPSVPAKTAG